MPSLAFSQPPSTSTGSTGACSGTVSRWAHSSTERPASRRSPLAARGGRDPREQVAAVGADRRAGVVLLRPRRRARAARRSRAPRTRARCPTGSRSGTAPRTCRSGSAARARRLCDAARRRRHDRPARCAGAAGAADRASCTPHARSRAGGALERGRDEVAEQRRRALRARLELGVELRGDEEGVVLELDHLDQALVGRGARRRAGPALCRRLRSRLLTS